mmetsp:Transcript_40470/g.52105  ORF Transcript_40470/g.52105 Transcript_40470/m.52105 type:complete len:279 (+) Transcript_40470:191-1027(+)
MNELAANAQTDKKKIKSTRMKRQQKNTPSSPSPDINDLLNQMGGGGKQNKIPDFNNILNQLGGKDGMAKLMKEFGGMNNFNDNFNLAEIFEGMKGKDISTVVNEGLVLLKESYENNPEFQQLLENPEQIKQSLLPFVSAVGGDMSIFDEILHDKNNLKLNMEQGIETLQELATSFIENLDSSTRHNINRLLSGDETVLAEMMETIDPNILNEMMSNVDVGSLLDSAEQDISQLLNEFQDLSMEEMMAKLEEDMASHNLPRKRRNTQPSLEKRGDSQSI